MAHFIYGVAENTGKGFFTAEDRRKFFLRGYPANVWMVGNNVDGAMWLAEKGAREQTKAEASYLFFRTVLSLSFIVVLLHSFITVFVFVYNP